MGEESPISPLIEALGDEDEGGMRELGEKILGKVHREPR